MRRILAASLAALALFGLVGCGSDGGSTTSPTPTESAKDSQDLSFDVSGIKKVDAIAALLPADIASRGKIVIGASIDYAPAQFRAQDLTTALGYEVDLGKALGKVLGVETEIYDAEFSSLLPTIGTKSDLGMSSFTITPERVANFNMIQHIMVGSSFAVKTGNPTKFDPAALCGMTIAVQTGTFQEEDLADKSAACVDAGNKKIDVLSYGRHAEATTNVVGGKAVAFYADSTVADFASGLTNGQLEVVGGLLDAEPQGIVVRQQDEELTEAMAAAMQHLMDDGTWRAILKSWGVDEDAALTEAEIHKA